MTKKYQASMTIWVDVKTETQDDARNRIAEIERAIEQIIEACDVASCDYIDSVWRFGIEDGE